MRVLALSLTLLVFAVTTFSVQGHDYAVGSIQIIHPWARATPSAGTPAAVYMVIKNTGEMPDRLIDISSPLAERCELHRSMIEEGIAGMRFVPMGMELPPGELVKLVPRGLHIMLIGIEEPLKEGESFQLILTFEKAGSISTDVRVGPLETTDDHSSTERVFHGDQAKVYAQLTDQLMSTDG
jgi:copper(I)-binding protein